MGHSMPQSARGACKPRPGADHVLLGNAQLSSTIRLNVLDKGLLHAFNLHRQRQELCPIDIVRCPLALPNHCSADGSLLPKQRRGTSLRLTSGFPTFCTNSLAHGSWFPISLRSELWYKADAACSDTTSSTLILAPGTSDFLVLPSGCAIFSPGSVHR